MFLIVLSLYPQNSILKIVIQMFEEEVIQLLHNAHIILVI